MKHLAHLLKWDTLLLHRNKLFVIAGVVGLTYVGMFYLLKPLGNLTSILIILIFNDPVVTGYMFAGVLWLFDREQHILQAISVLPVSLKTYLLSKTLILSSLATVISFAMTIAIRGIDFNPIHLLFSVFLCTFLYTSLGFVVASLSKNFNQFLMYSIPLLVLSGIPFLNMFGIGRMEYYYPLFSSGGIGLLQSAFEKRTVWYTLLMYLHLTLWTGACWKIALRFTTRKII